MISQHTLIHDIYETLVFVRIYKIKGVPIIKYGGTE